ncbi:UNVERIFIED_CONTAM: hypothetical protein GTU68_063837 [Idotea baltica]|nr:hypothetical protein [Idotea baltica]
MDRAEAEVAKSDPIYDALLYIFVPIQFILLGIFLYHLNDPLLTTGDIIGRITGMGMLCGVTGINLAHELGHRSKSIEIFMSKSLLLTSLYMHFYIEHNRGHHKHVSTYEDPASSRLNEALYLFWYRSITTGYKSAWSLEINRLRALNKSIFSFKNEMVQFTILQGLSIVSVYILFGAVPTIGFIFAALFGIILLETVNYIEHYGLQRKKNTSGRYEVTTPVHSWNSNHVVGRLFLFELSRHSDHHFKANRKYQILRHHDHSPQLPTGYPGMMLLSLIPPLWFSIMNKRIDRIKNYEL